MSPQAQPATYLFLLFFLSSSPHLEAQDVAPTDFGRLHVVGSAERAQSLPGSAHFIASDDLSAFDHTDVNRVLRQVPGLYIVDEEGYGLRPNIGMRGSGTDRSSRVTILEDGVLMAPSPYSAPAAYYFPTMARMSAVEVRKGSVAIKHGPYTTGGAVNFLSTPIPQDTRFRARLTGGSYGTTNFYGSVGGTGESVGFLLETVQQHTNGFKDLDGGGDTGYRLQDYLARFSWRPGGSLDQEFQLKIGAVEQEGNETYLGLTASDFDATPFRRYSISQLDQIDTEHRQYQVRHVLRAGLMDFTTVAYRHDFARVWYKLQTVGGVGLSALLRDPDANPVQMGWVRGETDSPDNAIVLRLNNREHYSTGIQHIMAWNLTAGGAQHDIELGLRLHRDEEDRLQNDNRYRMTAGRLVMTTAGAPGSQANRVARARASSIFLQDEIKAGDWIVTPGARYEHIKTERRSFALSDPTRSAGPTQVLTASHSVFIPGVGVSRRIGQGMVMFGSVHRGFTPPAPGSTTSAEESTNYEFGLRHAVGAFNGEVVGFYNDYSNLVGTCTASTGGGCNIGDQFSGGAVKMVGAEILARYDFRSADAAIRMPVTFAYTYTHAEFRTAFNSSFAEFGNVQIGDGLPYLPQHQWQLRAGLEANRWGLNLGASWVDEMRTTAGTGRPGRTDRTDSFLVVDLAGTFQLRQGIELFGKIDNLLDNDYIVAWRPAGARPGMPRAVQIGVRVDF